MEPRPFLISASAKPDVVITTVLVEVGRRIGAYRKRLDGGTRRSERRDLLARIDELLELRQYLVGATVMGAPPQEEMLGRLSVGKGHTVVQ